MPTRSSLLALVLVQFARCELLPVADDTYPYVKLSNAKSMNVDWQNGYIAQRLAASRAVRVNGRGVKFISGRHSELRLDPKVWKPVACVHDPEALCRIEMDGEVVSRVFPVWPTKVFSMMDTGPKSEYTRSILPLHCPETNSGRTVSDDTRDVSLCDVVGAGSDFVYDTARQLLYVANGQVPMYATILTSIGSVYTAILLSKNLDSVLQNGKASDRGIFWSILNPVVLGVIIGVIIFPDVALGTSFLAALVTREDQILFMALLLFSSARISPHVLRGLLSMGTARAPADDMYMVNPLICILILISIEFYCTADNPYAIALTVVFAIRWTMKVYATQSSESRASVELLTDALILSALLYYSVATFYDHTLVHVALFALQSWAVGVAIHTLVLDRK